jgi:hypothetical protein
MPQTARLLRQAPRETGRLAKSYRSQTRSLWYKVLCDGGKEKSVLVAKKDLYGE